MYFHCKEAKDHQKFAWKMPSLDEWLHNWTLAKHNVTHEAQNKQYWCYNPINYQFKFVQFDPTMGKDDLKRRYDVIGDNAQMDKSICMIFIKYTGWVPKQCDCTDLTNDNVVTVNSTNNDGNELAYYDPSIHAHGVQHHGATYQTTLEQDKLIYQELRDLDTILYETVKVAFQEQVQELEQQLGIKVCTKFRKD
jgi:hypothetical protein